MWTRRRRPDDYRALAGAPLAPSSTTTTSRATCRSLLVRIILAVVVVAAAFILLALIVPRRPAIQYVCTKFTGLHLDWHHSPFFYMSFTTFARIVNRNFFPVLVQRIQFDVYHWDEKIAETALEPRNFPARSRVVEAVHTNATGFTKTALAHLYDDTEDGVITIELRGRVQVRSFARSWHYDVDSEFLHVNLTQWSTPTSESGPCPPLDYTGPAAADFIQINSSR